MHTANGQALRQATCFTAMYWAQDRLEPADRESQLGGHWRNRLDDGCGRGTKSC